MFAAPPRTVPLALAMRATWTKLVNMVIRPPRAQYDPSECLPGPRFRIGGVAYRRVDVDLEGALGHLLRCSLYEPEIRGADPSPCVIYLHGNSGSRCDAVDAVRLLLPAGISVFALDLGGSGISEGEHVTLGVRETLDVAVVVAHLRRGGRVDRVGIWGRSMGAVTALLYANRDPSIAGIVLDSPFSSLTGLMSELVDDYFSASYVSAPRAATRLALGWMRSSIKARAGFDIHDLDVLRTVESTHCPALFAHGADDDFIDPRIRERFATRTPGRRSFSSSTATITRRGRRPSSTPRSSSSPERCTRVWTVWAGAGMARRGWARGRARGPRGRRRDRDDRWAEAKTRAAAWANREDTPTSFTAATPREARPNPG